MFVSISGDNVILGSEIKKDGYITVEVTDEDGKKLANGSAKIVNGIISYIDVDTKEKERELTPKDLKIIDQKRIISTVNQLKELILEKEALTAMGEDVVDISKKIDDIVLDYVQYKNQKDPIGDDKK